MQQTQSDIVHKSKLGMSPNAKVGYTARTHTTGGRDGASKSEDGRLEVMLSSPGTASKGTNPEQLFATGWSACFIGAMNVVARKMKVPFPKDTSIDAEVDLVITGEEYSLQARLNINLPGMDRETAQKVIDASTRVCPYSKAIEGNVDVTYHLV